MVTKEMICAAHDICLKKGDFVLSASLLERIYLAMRDKADGRDSAGWDAYEDLRKASDEMFLNLRQRVQDLEKQRDELLEENEQLRKDAERYRVLRDSEYQLDEDDPSVSDSFFNQYFGEELDAAVDELKSRFDSAIAGVKGEQ